MAVIEKYGDMDAGFVAFPYSVQEVFGVKGQVKIKALLDGKVEYRGSLAKMNTDCHLLGMTKVIRQQLGKSFGDTVDVELVQDTEARVVELPTDVAELFEKHPVARSFYETLSYTNRKEYIYWIESAKKEETRAKRLVSMIDKLTNRKKLVDP